MYIEEIESEMKRDFKVKVDLRLEEAYVVGAGDSYASALVAEGETGGRFKAIDPYDGLSYSMTDRPVVFISVSGKPVFNVKLAQSLKGKTETFALTSNPTSVLSSSVDHVIEIPYSSVKPLPGTLSFLMTTYAILRIAGVNPDLEDTVVFPLGDHPFFVGSRGNYGVSYYAYLKMSEIFGSFSNAERTEQFCHSPIFSSKDRQTIIFGNSQRERKLKELLGPLAFITNVSNPLANAISLIYSVLKRMKETGWDKIFFLDCRKILNVSSTMIYYDTGT